MTPPRHHRFEARGLHGRIARHISFRQFWACGRPAGGSSHPSFLSSLSSCRHFSWPYPRADTQPSVLSFGTCSFKIVVVMSMWILKRVNRWRVVVFRFHGTTRVTSPRHEGGNPSSIGNNSAPSYLSSGDSVIPAWRTRVKLITRRWSPQPRQLGRKLGRLEALENDNGSLAEMASGWRNKSRIERSPRPLLCSFCTPKR